VVSKLNARLKKLFILTGLLAAADMVQGTVMYAFGKSDGTILGKNGLIKTLRLPQGNELKNLVIMSLTTSVIVGTLSDRVENDWVWRMLTSTTWMMPLLLLLKNLVNNHEIP